MDKQATQATGKQDIIRLFNSGLAVADLVSTTGLPRASILAILIRARNQLARELDPTEDESNRAQVIRYYLEGKSFREMQRDVGLRSVECWAIIVSEDLPIREIPDVVLQLGRQRRSKESAKMYEDGHTVANICHQCAIDRKELYVNLRREGVVSRHPRARGGLKAWEVQVDQLQKAGAELTPELLARLNALSAKGD